MWVFFLVCENTMTVVLTLNTGVFLSSFINFNSCSLLALFWVFYVWKSTISAHTASFIYFSLVCVSFLFLSYYTSKKSRTSVDCEWQGHGSLCFVQSIAVNVMISILQESEGPHFHCCFLRLWSWMAVVLSRCLCFLAFCYHEFSLAV